MMENALESRATLGVHDAVLLDDPNDMEAFIENLRKRFRGDNIYTYIGPVLISVNPYRNLKLYGEKEVEKYYKANYIEVAPHVFGITENAYNQIREESRNQCILISGESGSGKTEASKKVLEYIAAASKHISSVEQTKDKLLQSNPVLEAFGNAQTNRNDNSSRFGKYMDIEFDYKGAPIGGHILNYLLEKSRVVQQSVGERNFHIFYQMIAGLDQEMLDEFRLNRNPASYHFLNQGKVKNAQAEDSEQFKVVTNAMEVVGIDSNERKEILNILAAILHIGNITFQNNSNYGKVEDLELVKLSSHLMQCSHDVFNKALTHRTIEARGEQVTTPLTRDQSTYARDAVCKAIYERLFNFLVHQLNDSLNSNYEGRMTLLGILDIYGFEIFEKNSFEQFCINYCNEKLQQLFIELTLKSEQEEYRKEGIEWEPVQYFNNKVICDLIEEKHKGIISLMDEECLRPGDTNDLTFLEKMNTFLPSHPHFITHKTANDTTTRKSIERNEFRLKHYAGEVTYNVAGFLDKNNDLLFRDLIQMMTESENIILQTVFPKSELERKKRPDTAATQFKQSLNELMEILMSKEPSYIRCIKPNEYKKSAVFDLEIVTHQVKYLGLMENLRVRRAGFAYRRNYELFLQRYKSLSHETWPNYHGDPKDGVEIIMKTLGYNQDHYRLGKTKIFIRHTTTLFAVEDAFQIRKAELVSKIKAIWKGRRQRKAYLEMRRQIIFVQKYARKFLAVVHASRRKKAANVIREFVKGFINRKESESEVNAKFLKYVRYQFLIRLSKNLPRKILKHDEKWPKAVASCQQGSKLICDLHRRQLVRNYIRKLSEEKKKQLDLKLLAHQLFKGKKCSYEDSVKKPFGDCRPSDLSSRITAIEKSLEHHNEKVVYCTSVKKYDRHGYKPRERILTLSNKCVYVHDAKDFKLKHRVELSDVLSVVATNMGDNLLVFRFPEGKKLKGDLIIDCPFVIETVTKIINVSNKNKSLLEIVPPGELQHKLKGGKSGVIEIVKSDNGMNFAKKNKHLIVYTTC